MTLDPMGAYYVVFAGWRWREWELDLVREWGDRENFLANKVEALGRLHDKVRAMAAEDGAPVVYETTGLSDASFVDGVTRDFASFVVRLDVGEDEALRRLRARPAGEHLTDAENVVRHVRSVFHTAVVPARRVDLVIDTETTTPDQACEMIVATLDQT